MSDEPSYLDLLNRISVGESEAEGLLDCWASTTPNPAVRQVLTTIALRDYARMRDRYLPEPETAAFFINGVGTRLSKHTVHPAFRKLIRQVGLEGRGQRTRPRPHDLRHSFAVRTLLGWYRSGAEVEREMPLLSTYLGHVQPVSTYWYLQAVPELLELVGRRLDGEFEEAR